MRFFSPLRRNLGGTLSLCKIRLYSCSCLRTWHVRMRLSSVTRQPVHWPWFQKSWAMQKFKMYWLHWSSSWLRVNGSRQEWVHASYFIPVTAKLVHRKRSSERSSLNYVTRTLLWFVEHVPWNWVNSPPNLRSNTSCKKFYQFSDNCLRMSRTPFEWCVLSHWFQWLSTFQRKKTRFTHLVLSLLPVKTSPGKCD